MATTVAVLLLACSGAFPQAAAGAPRHLPAATAALTPADDPTPTPAFTLPTDDDVQQAQRAAAAQAAEVASITARLEKAEARLRAIQREVAESVAADEQARARLASAESAARAAGSGLAAAQARGDDADRALSGFAAQMYMQGGDLQNLTTMLLSPPNVMADLAVVLDQDALDVRTQLDQARAATAEATALEQQLVTARLAQAAAATAAEQKRTAAEAAARRAGAEAARLSAQQEKLTARLDELERSAEDLVALREAAARLGSGTLLGLQAGGAAPRLAQGIARDKMADYRWDSSEFTCLLILWQAESGWSWSATNPSSGAYGIPQALPGWKMASAGSDWLTNPETQIDWGLGYIRSTYGSPCKAHDAFLSRTPHWY